MKDETIEKERGQEIFDIVVVSVKFGGIVFCYHNIGRHIVHIVVLLKGTLHILVALARRGGHPRLLGEHKSVERVAEAHASLRLRILHSSLSLLKRAVLLLRDQLNRLVAVVVVIKERTSVFLLQLDLSHH